MDPFLETVSGYGRCLQSRALRIFIFSWASLIGILIASRGVPPVLSLMAVVAISSSVTAVAYVYNDIVDLEIDKINNVDRPIAQGTVSKRKAVILVLLLTALALTLSLSVNLQTLLLCMVFLALGFSYSTPNIHLRKRLGPFKQIVPSMGGALSNLIGGAAIGNMPLSLLYAALFFFVFGIAGGPMGDLADVKGDREKGAKTIPVIFGPSFTIKLSVTILLCFSIITLLIYPLVGLSVVAPVVITSSVLFFSWESFLLTKKWRDQDYCVRAQKRLALPFFASQLAILLGAL